MDDNLSQSIQNITEQSSISFSDGPSQIGKKDHKPLIVGIICGIVGLMLGGVGVFGLIKLTGQQKECPECDYSEPSKPISASGIDLDFLKLENNNENIIYSPLSIRYGLSLLSTGADGETATEINNLLGDVELPIYQNEVDKLSLANAVFIKNDFKDFVPSNYISTVENKYASEVIYDNFTNTENIDNWVSQKTFGLIDKVGLQVNNKTEMVLANALAIQMGWQNDFDSGDTYGSSFYYDNGEEVIATTMHKETSSSNINYHIGDDVTVLSMPLAKTDNDVQLEFNAIMPPSNLGKYIENLTLSNLESTLKNTIPADATEAGINISIPKFKFDYELKFRNDLNSLGIVTAFDCDLADFSNMAPDKPLCVSDAIHKANIDFSEEGIKAAAITAFGMMEATAIAETDVPVEVTIDHPFFFVIRDTNSGDIWFTGAVYRPNLWEDDASSYR